MRPEHATLTELADRVDLTLANLSILKTGKACAVRFSTRRELRGALLPARRHPPVRAGANGT
jgi:DNA-binding Xre family transcriptional regulator